LTTDSNRGDNDVPGQGATVTWVNYLSHSDDAKQRIREWIYIDRAFWFSMGALLAVISFCLGSL
jgi:hypothetical protein